jgi:hypothetical protein
VLCKKNTTFGVLKKLFTRHFFIFFAHDTENVSFPQNLACMHILLTYMRKIFIQIFWLFEMFSWVPRASAPKFKIGVRQIIVVISLYQRNLKAPYFESERSKPIKPVKTSYKINICSVEQDVQICLEVKPCKIRPHL